jgi:hypothetical protein
VAVTPDPRRSALPSVRARALAFAAIAVAGACGGLIGWAFVNLQCDGSCEVPKTIGAVTGSLITSVGVAVVAVLGLRAMGEWRRLNHEAPAPPPGPPSSSGRPSAG